jgi:MFS family permease
MLIAIRVVQGLGSAMIFGTGVAIVTSVYPPGERGKALGIYITSVYIGLSTGPFLGGIMTQHFGWRSIFFVNVPIGLLAIVLILWKLKGEWAECRGEKFDLTGSLIYGLSVVAVMYGFSLLPDIEGASLLAAGIIGSIFFILYEKRIRFPVLDMNLLTKNRVFALSNLSALINYSATYAVTFLLSLDLQYTKGFTAEHAGFILIAQPVFQAMVSLSCRQTVGPYRTASHCIHGNGTYCYRSLFPDIHLRDDSYMVYDMYSHSARYWFWAIFIPKYQCYHEFGG